MQSSSQDENVVADEQQGGEEGRVGLDEQGDRSCLARAASLQDIRTREGAWRVCNTCSFN